MRARTLFFVVVTVIVAVPDWTGRERLPLLGSRPIVHAERVALDPADPARRRLGRLTFMGGVRLTSPDPAFGGFSSLTVAGDRFTLLSDGGNIVRFRLSSAGAVSDAGFAELPAGPGTGWRKRDRDSESMAVDPAGRIWVGFERANAIWRYAPGFAAAEAWARPAAMRRWKANGGIESLVRRRDGSFVAIQEEATTGDGTRDLLVWRGDPVRAPDSAMRLRYRPPAGFDPSDATELPDGRLLVLSRWWGLPLRFANALEVVDPAAFRPGAVVTGRRIATIGAPLTHDNFEGVTTTVERGRTMIWLLTDDDRMAFRQTLLLKFRLD